MMSETCPQSVRLLPAICPPGGSYDPYPWKGIIVTTIEGSVRTNGYEDLAYVLSCLTLRAFMDDLYAALALVVLNIALTDRRRRGGARVVCVGDWRALAGRPLTLPMALEDVA